MAARRVVPFALNRAGTRPGLLGREAAAAPLALLSALLTFAVLTRWVLAQEPAPTPTPVPAVWPTLLITEVMADPHATADKAGEWFELFNPGAEAVNLHGWHIADGGTARHQISIDLWIDPGAYAVFGRSSDPAANGGIHPVYAYADIDLANARDALRLLAPDSQEVARVVWGDGAGIWMTAGASLERVGNPPVATEEVWAAAHSPWPGSAGDLGSPGAPYAPPPTPTATPTLPPTALPPTATPLPTETAVLAPTPTPAIPDTLPRLRLSELMANPAAVPDEAGEWVEIVNVDTSSVNLHGWVLADLDRDRHTIAVDLWLQPGEIAVLARSGDPAVNGGVTVRYVYADLQLANEHDELLLITPWGVEADRIVWPEMGAVVGGASLERPDLWANGWVAALSPWDGSAGDSGSPGAPYTPPPTPTPVPSPTPHPDTPPPLVISEVMADPAAVGDDVGEWFEVYNADAQPVDLRDWQLMDLDGDAHTIAVNVVIQPGDYALFARSADATVNGGIYPHYVYSGLTLANQDDEILLLTPWGVEVSRAVWGDSAGIRTRPGASLERTSMGAEALWVHAGSPWPGSAGDLGSPGYGYVAAPTPPPATAPPGAWVRASVPGALVIEEVYSRGSDTEFIVLHNRSVAPVALAGWLVGDAESAGREGLYALPEDGLLAPDSLFVIARSGTVFRDLWGRAPDAELQDSDPAIPNLARRSDLASGQFALDDGGDEVVLLAPDLKLMDAVAYGSGAYDALGLTGTLRSRPEMSLQRVPAPGNGHALFWQQDQRHRFLLAPPQPFTALDLPAAQALPHPSLAHGMVALWGSLGVASTFSESGLAPPHYLLAAAGALGLDFLALADAEEPVNTFAFDSSQMPVALPAQRWETYGGPASIVDASRLAIPDGIPPLLDQRRAAAAPMLLAGSASPPLPGYLEPSPRYTGLAVTSADVPATQAAIAERRGWLTNRPGLWLTLVAESESSAPVWMGGTLDAANEVTLHIDYGDGYGSGGEVAGLALWQDNRVIQRNDTGLSGGRWSVRVAAVPGTFLYAVATQLDGDFAVTAPIFVRGPSTGRAVINEVHPLPDSDLNGDGATNGDDEFIEVYNPGSAPVALDGWRILLGAGESERRYTLGPQHIVPGGGWLVFWRGHTHLNLNEAGGALRLVNREGALVDEFAWNASPGRARSYSRFPNGSSWFGDTGPTPGGANAAPPERSVNPPREDRDDGEDEDDGALPATFGQATGPPGSLTSSKLAGLRVQVEFRAQVTVPPGLFNSSIYVAEPALDAMGQPLPVGGLGIHVFLYEGEFPPLEVGDWVLLRGELASFRGEMELRPDGPQDVWRIGPGTPLEPLPIRIGEIGESLEGRLVTFTGVISGWQGDSLYLSDPDAPDVPAVRVTVRSSLEWRRPYVQRGEVWSVTGIVNQFAYEPPWNGGYRVLVRFQSDLARLR